MRHQITILALLIFWGNSTFAQYPTFSISTDIGATRNWPKGQRFIALNNSICTDFHFTKKESLQVIFSYSTAGKYSNTLRAKAIDPGTLPQQLQYINNGKMRTRLLSINWKHYLKGNPQAEKGWNLYGKAGFGLLMGSVDNSHNRIIDTALYQAPVLSGIAKFKRMTLDLALGWEKPLGADFYFYTEARVSVPSPGYPSPFLLVNDNAPFMTLLCGGLRILF